MAIADSNTRVLITISKDAKKQLDKIAAAEKRTLSNLCAKILVDYLDQQKDGE
ncbi:MAG TPA: DNA-binding protein [Firmicutes bacterium]|nr:DNA-binding protein [Bacillota bacterium]